MGFHVPSFKDRAFFIFSGTRFQIFVTRFETDAIHIILKLYEYYFLSCNDHFRQKHLYWWIEGNKETVLKTQQDTVSHMAPKNWGFRGRSEFWNLSIVKLNIFLLFCVCFYWVFLNTWNFPHYLLTFFICCRFSPTTNYISIPVLHSSVKAYCRSFIWYGFIKHLFKSWLFVLGNNSQVTRHLPRHIYTTVHKL